MKRVIVLTIVSLATLVALSAAGCSKGSDAPQGPTESEPSQTATTEGHGASAPAAEETEASAGAEPASEVSSDEPEWKSLKHEAKAAKIDEAADEALAKLFAEHPKAKDLYAKAYGWAAFDNLKLALGVSGGGGNGVAVEKSSGERTYMKMGTGGVGLGIGGSKYQLVFLFEDATTFSSFVNEGWQADAGATAAAGTSAADAKAGFVNGLAIYQMTEKGLMLNADIAGTKYWQNKNLND
ncbi:MAG: YSC84-related protein [Thermoanaerobaculales bacterium]|jgi:lipid-binding SYLF domain-containing protein|nr:YSC84-related protein [Thermoanaerobaculales bacterium]